MLSLLHIENIAVIERADIQFDPGFNALTGETGAGKSIVIDAISAVLGERTSRELIRTGAKSALVNAVFTGVSGLGWLEENGVPAGEELLLQREIQGDGRNICRVDGRLVTVAQLRELDSSCWTRPAIWAIWTAPDTRRGSWPPSGRHTEPWRSCGERSGNWRWTRRSAPAGWTPSPSRSGSWSGPT